MAYTNTGTAYMTLMREYMEAVIDIESMDRDDVFKKAFKPVQTFDFLQDMLATRSNVGKNRFTSHKDEEKDDQDDDVAIDDDHEKSEDSDQIDENRACDADDIEGVYIHTGKDSIELDERGSPQNAMDSPVNSSARNFHAKDDHHDNKDKNAGIYKFS
jgi:hypothetical protein